MAGYFYAILRGGRGVDLNNLMRAIQNAWHHLGDAWFVKSAITLVVTSLSSVHGMAMMAFVLLVFVDLFTRWLALAYNHLKDCRQHNDLWNCIVDIPESIKAGYINSDAMKHRFVGKIIVYILLTFMAVNVDKLLFAGGEAPIILKLVWTYLAATEAMSVLENLRDAGIEQANSLLDFFRDKFTGGH